MQSHKNRIELNHGPEQRSQVWDLTGMDADTPELSVEELEERIVPNKWLRPR
jgi:hypothetical protein